MSSRLLKTAFVFTALLSFITQNMAISAEAIPSTKTLKLNYDGFFDRIEKLDEPEFASVKLAFYLKSMADKSVCPIESVKLKTKLKERNVYFYETGEILIPYDKQLDLDKAKVVIQQKTNSECALDMRLEAVANYGKSIKVQELLALTETFDKALKEQAGMMSFLMPEVNGITIIGDQSLVVLNFQSEIGVCNKNRCTFKKKDLEKIKEDLVLNAKPQRIIPYLGD